MHSLFLYSGLCSMYDYVCEEERLWNDAVDMSSCTLSSAVKEGRE